MRATRREFLTQLGGVAGAALARTAEAQERPLKIGHMTFFTGPAAVLGEPLTLFIEGSTRALGTSSDSAICSRSWARVARSPGPGDGRT